MFSILTTRSTSELNNPISHREPLCLGEVGRCWSDCRGILPQAEHAGQHHCGRTAGGYPCVPRAVPRHCESTKCELLGCLGVMHQMHAGAFLASHSFRLVHMLGCSCPCRMTTCPCSSGKIAEFPFPFPLAQVSSRVAFKGYIAFGVLFILHAQHGSWSGSPIEVWPCYACTGPLFQPLVEALTVQQRQLSGFCSRNCVATSESL